MEEYLGVVATKQARADYRQVYLFPETSYMWGNCRDVLFPREAARRRQEEEEERDYWEDDRHYDDEDDYRGGYSDDERYGPPGCTCDASEPPARGRGPVFCCCRDRDDY